VLTAALIAAQVPFSYPKTEVAFDSAETFLAILVQALTALRFAQQSLVAFINAHAGRAITLGVDGVTIGARTVDEIDRLIGRAKELRLSEVEGP